MSSIEGLSPSPRNLLSFWRSVDRVVLPKNFPKARWPSKSAMVLAQQFAVNKAMELLAEGHGLYSINGPPGTGKTTLLRDLIAAILAIAKVEERTDLINQFAESWQKQSGAKNAGRSDPARKLYGAEIDALAKAATEAAATAIPSGRAADAILRAFDRAARFHPCPGRTRCKDGGTPQTLVANHLVRIFGDATVRYR
jgi:hypothetical protein